MYNGCALGEESTQFDACASAPSCDGLERPRSASKVVGHAANRDIIHPILVPNVPVNRQIGSSIGLTGI